MVNGPHRSEVDVAVVVAEDLEDVGIALVAADVLEDVKDVPVEHHLLTVLLRGDVEFQ